MGRGRIKNVDLEFSISLDTGPLVNKKPFYKSTGRGLVQTQRYGKFHIYFDILRHIVIIYMTGHGGGWGMTRGGWWSRQASLLPCSQSQSGLMMVNFDLNLHLHNP